VASRLPGHVEGRAFNGPVALATRDYGGDGPDLLFLPGAGQTLVDCDLLAPWLTEHHRVVSMDLRGHGDSGDAAFTWDAALDDIDSVTAALGLNRPAVVGHSLGGMLAAMHGARHPDSPGVVNLDGHGEGRPEHYIGVPPELLAARFAELRLLGDAAIAAAREAPSVLPEVAFEPMVQHYQALYGLDAEFARGVLTRSHVRAEGGLKTRVSLDLTLEIVACVRELDLAAVYRACAAPLLVLNAVKPAPVPPGSPPWMAEHVAGFRRGLSAELAVLSTQLQGMTFLEIDATHALVYEQPELVSKQVVAFLAAAAC
jgi:pimeloyl-ACP methyl ester carboxylesterase